MQITHARPSTGSTRRSIKQISTIGAVDPGSGSCGRIVAGRGSVDSDVGRCGSLARASCHVVARSVSPVSGRPIGWMGYIFPRQAMRRCLMRGGWDRVQGWEVGRRAG